MHILHVIPSLGPQRGGPVVVARALATGLVTAGLKVTVIATDDNGRGKQAVPLYQAVVEQGVTYRYFPRQTRFYTVSWPLAQWLDQHITQYDLLHIHGLFSFAPLIAAWIARKRNRPYLIRPLGTLNRWGMQQRKPLLKQLSFQLLDRHALAGAAAVHYTSEQERIEAASLGVPHRGVVIPLPVALPAHELAAARGKLSTHYPQLQGRTVVLFLSRLDQKKGLDLLIPAFAEARRSNPALALVIAGSGEPSLVTALQALAAREGVADAIIWTGFVSGEAKLAALAEADFFVLPSYSENFGIAAVEAMAAGLPVILSDQIGIHHDVHAAGAGLITPCSVQPLVTALTRLAADHALRQQLGQAAKRFVQHRYSTDAVCQQVLTLYTDLLGRRTGVFVPLDRDRNP
ncbi:MAG: glycosyltransferase [Oscillochloridaceae bacterium umkhey_bin13]